MSNNGVDLGRMLEATNRRNAEIQGFIFATARGIYERLVVQEISQHDSTLDGPIDGDKLRSLAQAALATAPFLAEKIWPDVVKVNEQRSE